MTRYAIRKLSHTPFPDRPWCAMAVWGEQETPLLHCYSWRMAVGFLNSFLRNHRASRLAAQEDHNLNLICHMGADAAAEWDARLGPPARGDYL